MSKPSANVGGASAPDKSYFEQQRELLARDIGSSMEQVLQNINKLNRSLEGVVSVGAEFATIESLWSHFEGVMAAKKDDEADDGQDENTALDSNRKISSRDCES